VVDGEMPEMDGFMLVEHIRRRPAIAATPIVMLTSAGRPGDAARCRELGVERYLVKPVRQTQLREAILGLLAASQGSSRIADEKIADEASAPQRPLRILIADDNAVNQMILSRILEKHGHTVATALNGREAVDAVQTGAFDLVMMDVQMPVMDGVAATAEIRRRERTTGSHLPIIAVTADAMQGDRERYLAADMDGYISKPIERSALLKAIAEAAGDPG